MPVFSNRRKPQKATADGTYVARGSQFRIRKGSPIPEGVEVVYNDPNHEVTTADQAFANKIAEDREAEEES